MDIEVGMRVVVLRNTYFWGHLDIEEGEIVTVVATKQNPTELGGLIVSVCREGETALHHVHSSGIVQVEGRPIAEMSAAALVERYFEVEKAGMVIRVDCPEFDSLHDESRALFEALPKTPSQTHRDLVAKLKFAEDFASDDESTCPFLTGFLNTLGSDYDQLLDHLAAGDAIAEKAAGERAAVTV